jgi:hypothetical protein
MSPGFSVVPSDLVTGSQAVSGHADGFAGIGETFSGAASSGTEFGSTSLSGQVSDLTSRFSALHGQEFGAAHRVLKGTATALTDSAQNYTNADNAASTATQSIVAR